MRIAVGAVLVLALAGCATSAVPAAAPPAVEAPECDTSASIGTDTTAAPDGTVAIAFSPADCRLDEAWFGEVVLRTPTSDIPTGVSVGAGTVFPLDVVLPAGLDSGQVFVMLVPEVECADVLTTADCHYPFFPLTIT